MDVNNWTEGVTRKPRSGRELQQTVGWSLYPRARYS